VSLVWLLIVAQILAQTAAITFVALSALIGYDLADNKALATLPLAIGMVAGAALTIPAAGFMQRFGRRPGFQLGAVAGLCSAGFAVAALHWRNFALFLMASAAAGAYQACFQFYRFAAAEAVEAAQRSRVLSFVVSGGIVAAFTGPAVARLALAGDQAGYEHSFIVLGVLAVSALLLLSRLPARTLISRPGHGAVRSFSVLVAQPVFLTALTSSAVGVAVMSMIMSATPLAMQYCGLPRALSPTVIQWHMIGMFVPSLFTGEVIKRFGVLPTMLCGAFILLLQIAVSTAGVTYPHFATGLLLLGVGWNFLYIGGSTLLARASRSGEEGRVQAMHDMAVYALASLATTFSGGLLTAWGWNVLNFAAVPALAVVLLAIGLQWRNRRQLLAGA
jgi:MFS family permease